MFSFVEPLQRLARDTNVKPCHVERNASCGSSKREVETSRRFALRHADLGNSPQTLSPQSHFAAPFFGQVLPAGIQLFNQRNLLRPSPAFQLLFPADRPGSLIEPLVIDK